MSTISSLAEEGFLSDETAGVIEAVELRCAPWLSIVRAVNARAVRAQYEANVPRDYPPALVAAICYMRTLTNVEAAVLLALRGMDVPARILLRSAMESLFQLKAVERDPNVVNSIIAGDDVFRRKLLEKYKRMDDPKLNAELERIGEPKSEAADKFKEWGVKTLSVEQLAAKADLTPLYLSTYPLLSNAAHSGIRDLERHVETDDTGLIVALKNEPEIDDLETPFLLAAEFLMIALEGFAGILGLDLGAFLEEPRQSQKALVDAHQAS